MLQHRDEFPTGTETIDCRIPCYLKVVHRGSVHGGQIQSTSALATPLADLLLGGGLSLLVLPLLMMTSPKPLSPVEYGVLIALGIAFNWPHFVASYFLLYATRDSISQNLRAAVWIPLAVLAYGLFAIGVSGRHPIFMNLLTVFAGVYLARHYTGQTFGVMSSFAHLDGAPFEPAERSRIRAGLNILMVWHIVWALHQSIGLVAPGAAPFVALVYSQSGWLFAAGFLWGSWGAAGFLMRMKKLSLPLPVRILVPWCAIAVWYIALARDPSALLAVQAAHALQYLVFPIRMQLNRGIAENRPTQHWALYVAIWFVIGLAVFEGVGPLFGATFRMAGGQGNLTEIAPPVLIICIGIHHYFIDGYLFRLRNPRVRTLLFAHVRK